MREVLVLMGWYRWWIYEDFYDQAHNRIRMIKKQ